VKESTIDSTFTIDYHLPISITVNDCFREVASEYGGPYRDNHVAGTRVLRDRRNHEHRIYLT